MLPSGNDAAQAVAEALGVYSFRRLKHQDPNLYRKLAKKELSCYARYFIDDMNEIADKLSLSSSTFTNPHGLMEKTNQSSALDIARIVLEGIDKYPLFKSVISCKSRCARVARGEDTQNIEWTNTHLLIDWEHFVGGKTGVTVSAGPCLATALCVPGTRDTISIVLLKCSLPLIKVIQWKRGSQKRRTCMLGSKDTTGSYGSCL
jgi:D-alanyl-D-alanine carboxypeptidase